MNSYSILILLIFSGHFHYIISSDSNQSLIIKVVWCFLNQCHNKWQFTLSQSCQKYQFLFDRVGYSNLQNSVIIMKEHIKKEENGINWKYWQNCPREGRVYDWHTTAVSLLQALVCEAIQNLICLFNVLLDISVSIVNYGISFYTTQFLWINFT